MKRIISLLLAAMLTVTMFATACQDTKEDELIISTAGNITTIVPGGELQFTASKSAVFEITEGEELAEITADGLLTANTDADAGGEITVKAVSGSISSNEITVNIIDILVTAIKSPLASVSILKAGDTATLSCIIEPSNATKAVVWEIINGYEDAEINGNILSINDDAVNGQIIILAKSGEATSSAVTVTVSDNIPLKSITISTVIPELTTINPGDSLEFQAELNPATTTESNITWELTQSLSGAHITSDGILVVQNTALDGKVKVRASRGDIHSNEIEINIVTSLLSLSAVGASSVTVKNKTTDTWDNLQVKITDDNGNAVSGDAIYEIIDGDEFIRIQQNASDSLTCRITHILAHGIATVKATLVGNSDEYVVFTVNAVKTPSMIDLPAYLEHVATVGTLSSGYATGISEEIPFTAVVPQTGVDAGACTDVKYTFKMEGSSVEGDEVGEYSDGTGRITFKKTGLIRVTATTDSGNPGYEATESQLFRVNEGYNISTWEELKTLMETAKYLGGLMGVHETSDDPTTTPEVNFVVTEKITGDTKVYNYEIVPDVVYSSTALSTRIADMPAGSKNKENVIISHCQITYFNNNVELNGNNHAINIGDITRLPAGNDVKMHVLHFGASMEYNETDYNNLQSEAIEAFPTFTYEVNDLKIYGSVSVSSLNIDGTHEMAIDVGRLQDKGHYEILMNNIEIAGFDKAIHITKAIEGSLCKDVKIYDIYSNAIQVRKSIIEFEDLDIGDVGTCGIELIAKNSGKAGKTEDQNQKLTISGTYNPCTPNNTQTKALNGFVFGEYTTMGILNLVIINAYSQIIDNIRTANECFYFAIFAFSIDETNFSEVEFADEVENPIQEVTNRAPDSPTAHPSYITSGMNNGGDVSLQPITGKYIKLYAWAPANLLVPTAPGYILAGHFYFLNPLYEVPASPQA